MARNFGGISTSSPAFINEGQESLLRGTLNWMFPEGGYGDERDGGPSRTVDLHPGVQTVRFANGTWTTPRFLSPEQAPEEETEEMVWEESSPPFQDVIYSLVPPWEMRLMQNIRQPPWCGLTGRVVSIFSRPQQNEV